MTRTALQVLPAFALGAALVGLAAVADDKKPPADADWSKFVTAATYQGEVTKVDGDAFTLKTSPPGGKGRGSQLRLTFAEAGLVRWKAMPPKLDEKGKRVPYTEKEKQESKLPKGFPGYAAERADLKAGMLVEVTMVRPKDIPAAKAALQDLQVKHVVIAGTAPTPPEPKKKPDEKKKDEKKDKTTAGRP